MTLKELEDSLKNKVTAGTLIISANDIEVQKISNFIATLPTQQIVCEDTLFDTSQPNMLKVSGKVSGFWTVSGFSGNGVSDIHLSFHFSQNGSTKPLQGDLIIDDAVWLIDDAKINLSGIITDHLYVNCQLGSSSQPIKIPLTKVADFAIAPIHRDFLPLGVEIFELLPLSSLQLQFGFSTNQVTTFTFTSNINAEYALVEGVLSIKEVGLTLNVTHYLRRDNSVGAAFSGNIHGDITIGAEFLAIINFNNKYNWELDIVPKNGNALPTLLEVAAWAGGNSLKSAVDAGLKALDLDEISVDELKVFFDLQKRKINSLSLLGHITIAKVKFNIYTILPDFQFGGSMDRSSSISIKSLIEYYFYTAENFPEILITDIALVAHPSISFYSFHVVVEDDWVYKISEHQSFALKEIELSISKSKGKIFGSFSATLHFLEIDIILSAAQNAPNVGWQLEGSTGQGQNIPIGQLIQELATKFDITSSLPKPISGLTINNLSTSFNTQTKDFTFSIETKFPIDKNDATKALDAVINIEITHNNDKYTRKFSGIVKVGDLEFDLLFQQEQDTDTVFLAAFENKAGKDESIQTLVALITDNTDILKAAEGVSFNLKDALLVIDKGTSTKILFGLDIGGGLDLSKLPLIGKMLPENATVRMTFQPLLTNQDFLAPDLDKIRTLVPTGGFQLPKEAKERLGFSMQLMVSKQLFDLSLPIKVDEVKKQPDTAALPATSSASTANTSAAPPASTSNIKWFVIQKQLGPISFGRVGVQYEQSQLYFLLDASLSLAGLTISLDGLFVSSTLNPIQPKFGLHGLGIDYKKGPLEIGGAFLRQTFTDKAGNTYDTYDGTAIIRTEKFALAALGSYAYYQGHPSLFIYAFLDVPLGGPAFFFVTGIAAGFGYNRRVVVPSIDGVATFPLVAEAVSGVPDKKTDLNAEIQKLQEVIPPAVGEYFFAVGIRFNSFKIIDSFALLMVSFGLELEVDVLGLSTLVIPTPDAESAIEPLAEVQLALRAVFNPDKGYLKVQAVLTSASFILSRECHLTGGFAFYTWFKDNPEEGASAGEFVLTIGGYHPAYKPPAHYPKVPLLGFNWQVVPELIIKGDLYFALVPSAVMAGGYFSATFTDGGLKAWFKMGVDFIISWKPYFYDAHLYVDFGVSYTFELFGTHTLTLELGADLHIWGPEFSGTAQIHIWIFTVGVNFGAGNSQEPPELSWKEFREGFLPAIPKWESVAVTKGLVNQLKTGNDNWFIVNPKEFVMETSSALPITTSNLSLGDANVNIQIGSMGIIDQLTSSHNIIIKFGNKDVTADFSFTPIKKNAPGALWGKKLDRSTVPKKEEQLVKDTCMGFSIKGKAAQPSLETHSVDSEKLLNEKEPFGKGIQLGKTPAKLDKEWLKNKGVRNKVTEFIESKQEQRTELLKALGFQDTYYPNKELADELVLTGV